MVSSMLNWIYSKHFMYHISDKKTDPNEVEYFLCMSNHGAAFISSVVCIEKESQNTQIFILVKWRFSYLGLPIGESSIFENEISLLPRFDFPSQLGEVSRLFKGLLSGTAAATAAAAAAAYGLSRGVKSTAQPTSRRNTEGRVANSGPGV